MTGAWLAYALLVGALLAGMAQCLSQACRLAARPTRWVWIVALGLTVVLVTLAPYRMAPPTSVSTPAAAVPASFVFSGEGEITVQSPTLRWTDRLRGLRAIGPTVAAPMQAAIAAAGARIPQGLMHHFTTLWLSLSALVLGLYAATYVRFYRLRHSWPVADLDGVRVRIAPDSGPAVVGWSRPEIIVPWWLFRHTPEARRLVLAHEREHVDACDPRLIALGCAIAVLLPWHPAVWWMFARLRLAVELDCDMRVLRQGVAPRTYGTLLIDLAGRSPGMPVGAAALADQSSHLRQRLLAIRAPRLSFARTRGAALGALAAFVLTAACVVQIPSVMAQPQKVTSVVPVMPSPPAPTLSPLESAATQAPWQNSVTQVRVARRPKRTTRAIRLVRNSIEIDSSWVATLNPAPREVSASFVLVSSATRVGLFTRSKPSTSDTTTSTDAVGDLEATGEIYLGTRVGVLPRSAVLSPATMQLRVMELGDSADSAGRHGAHFDFPIVTAPTRFRILGKLVSADSSKNLTTITVRRTDQKP